MKVNENKGPLDRAAEVAAKERDAAGGKLNRRGYSEKVWALVRQAEARGHNRSEICRVTGISRPTLIRGLGGGKIVRKRTKGADGSGGLEHEVASSKNAGPVQESTGLAAAPEAADAFTLVLANGSSIRAPTAAGIVEVHNLIYGKA